MPLPNQRPLRWAPAGLSDALDGTDAFPGAMSALSELIFEPNSKSVMIARPAAVPIAQLPDYGGGPIVAQQTVGDVCYGMAASSQYAGKDRPFAYNMATGQFLSIAGLASANLPASQPATGDWTPPTISQIGSRVVFTHPGFPGGTSQNTVYLQVLGNTYNGSNLIDGYPGIPVGTFADPAGGPQFQAGWNVAGVGIPVGTTITAIQVLALQPNATGSSGASTFTVSNAAGIVIGQQVYGPGLASVVTNVSGTTITISNTLGQNLSATPVLFYGEVLTLSQNATASNNNQALFIWSAAATKFGWLDLSSFATGQIVNTNSGSPVLTGNPTIAGMQPGMTVSGPGIPNGTAVVAYGQSVSRVPATTTSGSNVIVLTLSTILSLQDWVGAVASGPGIPTGSVIISGFAGTIMINQNCTASGSITITISGAYIICSKNATATAQNIAATIAGGSPSAPLWGAGDATGYPLPNVPVFVEQFSGRAYFGVNTSNPPTSGVVASDVGIACQVSNANQVVTFQDAIPVTAAQGLALFNQLGGIIQSLMVFQGAANVRQITGDFALGNWSQNSLQTAIGTLAPNSIAQTPVGLLFAAPDGLRLIDFDARMEAQIGDMGDGLVLPFINAVTPSRMESAYNQDVYRLTVTWRPPARESAVWGSAQRTDEFWFHLKRRKWTGPHSSIMDQLAAWQTQNSFICAPSWAPGWLYRSDVVQRNSSTYIENGRQLNYTETTVLLPDNPEQQAMQIIESSLFFSMSAAAAPALIIATDDDGNQLDQINVSPGPGTRARQRRISWSKPLVFRQLYLSIVGKSEAILALGAINLRYQVLPQQLPDPVYSEFVLGQSILGGPDVLGS